MSDSFTLAGRSLVYFLFGNADLAADAEAALEACSAAGFTAADVYGVARSFAREVRRDIDASALAVLREQAFQALAPAVVAAL